MNLNHILIKVGRGSSPYPIFNLIFSESTWSGVSKISNHFSFQAIMGEQVPQHDVTHLENMAAKKMKYEYIKY
jgi:hypothetical protein